jgi:hypothetical protein
VTATNRALLILDIIKGVIGIIAGNIGFPTLILYLIGMLQPARQIPITTEKALITALCLVVTLYCFHSTGNKVIKALIVILIFVPLILMLLSYFAVLKVPLPF